MPRTQTANVAIYDFGAPVTEDAVLTFQARRGGRLTVRLENYGDTDLAATLQVSDDGSTWADTTAAANTTAVADVTIPPRQYREYQISLRDGEDAWMRLQASGGVRGQMQVRGDEILIVHAI